MNVKNYAFLMFMTIVFFCTQKDVNGNTLRDSVEMKTIPAGEFIMGSKKEEGRADERPQRKIYLDTYEIDSHEVSNNHYLNFIQSTGRKDPLNPYSEKLLSDEAGIGNLPIVQVTWYDAVDYCRWAGKYLPSEAQWEKAARGDTGLVYPWGSESLSNKQVNFEKNWEGTLTLWPVETNNGTSSTFGIKGMAGNVREWVQDWYAPDYFQTAPHKNPRGPGNGILKVIKGGSWHSFKADVRAASRGKGGFALKTDGIGFRCARKIDIQNSK
jgi:formylglycine-generating enzyme required for sulfatase activity